jgi:hypothetical protein
MRYQGPRCRRNAGLEPVAHEFAAPALQLARVIIGEGPERKLEKGINVELAALILAVETFVEGAVFVGVHDAAALKELAPQVITVAGEERVVEVEKR